MQSISVCAFLVLVALGCAEPKEESLIQVSDFFATGPSQVSDFAGQYYYATSNSTCASLVIDSAGVVYTTFFSGVCGSGSRVECVDSSCSLTCLQFNNGDTTAIFSITDQRPFAEVTEKSSGEVRKGSIPDALALSPYRPRGLSATELFDGMEERMATGVYINLFFHLVDCEYAIKSAADEVSEE